MALLNDCYDALSVIYENSTTVIYRGIRKADGLAVMLKTYKNADEGFRVRHEYDLLHGKEVKGAGRVLGVSYNDDKTYLVRADEGAVVLDSFITDHKLDTAAFLQLAQNAALALDTIHKAGIVHCDVKPANMLVHPDTLDITYIDFGISFQTHRRSAQQNQVFAGTLEFMAPEQTGRLNMEVDTRSDLYSLGITLYFLLTGAMPFTGERAVDIIHAQTVLPPAPMSRYTAVDPTVEAIVFKLMKKAPRKRYQHAESLAYDLGCCLADLNAGHEITEFMLGEKDVFASLEPGQRLFGKKSEMNTLVMSYRDTGSSASNLVLLHGSEGTGKSNLIESFEAFVERQNGYLLRGSFDWRSSSGGYSGIRDMFEGFELYAYNVNLPLPEYRSRLLAELGENAGVLTEILPSAAAILENPAPPKTLNPAEAAERARAVFTKALEVICNAPYPYVLVFDDVQWADDDSLDLLLAAIESSQLKNCMMLLCYRDDDPVFLERMGSRLKNLDKNLAVTDIPTGHLSTGQIAEVLEVLFDIEDSAARSFAEVLFEATGGVMETLRELLQSMYRDRQIRYDAATDTWSIDSDGMSGSIMESLESKYRALLGALKEEDRLLLMRLSCIGESFDIANVQIALDLEAPALVPAMDRLGKEGWLTPGKEDPNIWGFKQKAVFDLCYSIFEEEEKINTLKQIAGRLYPVFKETETDLLAHAGLLSRQVTAAGVEKFDCGMRSDIARAQLLTAQRFVQAANLQQAAREFESGIALLGDKPFEDNYDLATHFYLDYVLCSFAQHRDDFALELLEMLLENVSAEEDFYQAHYRVVEQYLARAEWEMAKKYARQYLDAVGLLLGDEADYAKVSEAEYQQYLSLSDGGKEVYWGYPHTEDPQFERHGNMLAMMAEALSFSLDKNAGYYLYSAINRCLEKKERFSLVIKVFPVAAARHASVQNYERAKEIILAGLAFAEKAGEGQAFLWCVYGNMVSHWVNPQSELLEIHKQAKYHAMLEGNAFYEAYADLMLLSYHCFMGEQLEEFHGETMKVLHNLERSGLEALRANFTTYRQYARCLLGRTENSSSFDDDQFKESSLELLKGTWHGSFNEPLYYMCRLRSCYVHLHFDKGLEYAEKYAEYAKTHNMTAYLFHIQFVYYYSITLLELCRLHPENKETYLAQIRENQKEQKRIAEQNPLNFYFKNQLVETGVKGLDYQGIELVDEFAAEHKGFVQKGLMWDAVIVERLIGNFWHERGIYQYELIHKDNRRIRYLDMGAKVCLDMLGEHDEEAQLLRGGTSQTGTRGLTADVTNHTHTQSSTTFVTQYGSSMYTQSGTQRSGINAALDLEELLMALEKLMSQTSLQQLSNEFARRLLLSDNAERVYLFLADGPVTRLCAAAYAIDGTGGFTENELPLNVNALADKRVPKKLVSLVIDQGKAACANSAQNDYRRMGDEYLGTRTPESFVCLPLSQGGKVLGAVYMENASLPGAFPEGRLEFLATLARQASALMLNLQNAEKLAGYTKDLEKRLSGYLSQQNALIAGIAHEINSPVGVCLTVATKIHDTTQTIIEAFNNKQLGMRALHKYLEETREGLDIINNNIMRAGDLIQNFKQMSVEQSTEVFETVELAPTLKSIVDYVRPGVKKQVSTIDIEVPENLQVYSSSGVLAQVFTNLIMNSGIHGFEHSPKEKNKIRIIVTDRPEEGEIEIRYSDNGCGMDDEASDKVFEPFYTTKRNRGGSGLGGHIVLTCITQQLGGSIVCQSKVGQGTTFIIRMPKSKPQVQEGVG